MAPPDEEDRARLVPKAVEALDWPRVFQSVGLDSPEKIERLNRLLVVHLLIDRLLTLALAAKLASCSSAAEPDIDKIVVDNATRPIPDRAEAVYDLGLIDRDMADKILRVNAVRNRLVHFKPKRDVNRWNLDEAEIISQEASDSRVKEGIEAVQALWRPFLR
jgi:hypothetical protein